jgi:hypothetical protein
MVNKTTSEKKSERRTFSKAISSSRSREFNCRNTGVISKARRLVTGRQSSEASETTAAVNQRLQEMEAYNQTLRKRVVDLQAQLQKARAEKSNPLDASLHEELQHLQTLNAELQKSNSELRAQLAAMKEEVESASKAVNIAWQQGYLAGQLAGQQEQVQHKGFIETLAEAAQAATAYGGGESASTATATVTETQEAAPPPAEEPYVVASPDYLVEALQLNDPEVLNDPFTAKLLGALGTEVELGAPLESEGEYGYESEYVYAPEEPPVAEVQPEPAQQQPLVQPSSSAASEFSCEPDGMMFEDSQHVGAYMAGNAQALRDEPSTNQTETQVDLDAQQTLLSAEEGAAQQEPLYEEEQPEMQEPPPAAAAGEPAADAEGTGQFTADELHSLFRNKYVRPDDPPEKAQDPTSTGNFPTMKKFVGTNKSQSEPLPTAPRVFPPDIRKACKLLGLNPEELSRSAVTEAWKREMAKPGVHPDTGGDTEMAIYLNTAKDTLMRWVDDQTPKLGKKFGNQGGGGATREQTKPKQE